MSTAQPGPMVSVERDAASNRYVITRDGTVAGFTEYALSPGSIAFLHTEIAPEFGGQGLASVLIKAALDDVRSQGLSVEPYCPFVRRYISRHPDYLELVAPAVRAQFEL